MRTTFFPLISLFISCFILLLGNGLINVLLPVRMGLDSVNTDTIGMVLSLYFVGMLLGALYSLNLIRRAGHIRMFSGCVALGAVSILVCSLYTDPLLWGAMRIVLGFCNACAFTAMESWLSDSSTQQNRGKVLGVYNAVVLSGLFGGQFFMNIASPDSTMLFVIAGILLCAAVIPVALSSQKGPLIEEVSPMSLLALYKISPLGVVSCLASGLIYSAILSLLPVFAKSYQIVDFQLSLYIGSAILGAFILQFPVGYLSDRFDRRTVLLCLLLISAAVSMLVTVLAPLGLIWAVYLATAITNGIIACTYPLSISEAFDKLRQSEMVAAMGSMILAFAIGGVLGPYSASLVMEAFGNDALFYFLTLTQLMLAAFVMFRMTVRQALPVEEQESFVMQGAAISAAIELDPRTEYVESQYPLSAEVETAVNIAETDPAAAVTMARAIAMSNPAQGVEVASAVATVEGINVLRLYEVMKEAVPYRILDVTRGIVTAKPELAYELVTKLAEWYPAQVVAVAAEIGCTIPELRVEMARVAVEAAPESATEVAAYYAQVLADEHEAVRPADRDEDNSQEDAVSIVSELWEQSPEQALEVAVAMVDVVPETAVPVAEEYLARHLSENPDETDEATEEVAIELVQRLTEASPEDAIDVAAAVVEVIPESAVPVAEEYLARHLSENPDETDEATEEVAVELVQRLTEASPDDAMDVAVAVVEVIPESASEVVNAISQGDEAKEGEWVESVDDKPEDYKPKH
ncbi:MAG: MFS transporter [Pontibacterium sp.]